MENGLNNSEKEKKLKKGGRFLVDNFGVDMGQISYILIGPLIFLAIMLIPIPTLDWQARGGLGVLIWMAFWWTSGHIAVAITALVPIFVTTFIPIAPVGEIVSVFSHRIVFLIAGSCAMGAAWQRWGIARRLSLKILSLFGNSARKQIWAWFLISALLSSIIADTVTAAVFVPVAVTLLKYLGYDSNSKRWNNAAATNILLAIAWGASIGSLPTPLGGGQNLLIYEFLTEAVGRQIYFYEWTIRMLPFTLFFIPFIGFYLTRILQKEDVILPGSKEIYQKELDKMGKLSKGELYSGLVFVLAVSAAFLEPLYTNFLPFLDPAFIFFSLAFLLFFIPTEEHENVLSIKSMGNFPITVMIVWPSALALAKVLEHSGLAEIIGENLSFFATGHGIITFLIFAGVTVLLTNISTNTASAALLMPVIIQLFIAQGINPVPIILLLTVSVNLSFAIASGNGCLAVSAGYGVNLKTMFKHGIIIAFLGFFLSTFFAFFLDNILPWWGVL
ncbi:SLC13 family permease [Halanaerobium hydrogeniformans]|uniref:Sodium-dependent dicarboxylate transporter SdcS n=1 Tax=Halanaerobium hydrogeniformans TaxID=656519 RepID=E4RK46_HALHG|nr:SLC13 family permease [Halanaerobium hydrogeniformans]ADQ14598.1 Citrate transporter [Halanaerobium hydrogeniformans]